MRLLFLIFIVSCSQNKIKKDNKSEFDKAELTISGKCRQGDYKAGFSLADQQYDSAKNNPQYWNQIGTCYYLRKEYKKSILFYNKAKGLNAYYAPALNNLGVVFESQKDFKTALFFYKSAVNYSPSSQIARFNLANIYLKFGMFKKGCAIFYSLAKSLPNNIEILNARGSCALFTGNYPLAVSQFKQIPGENARLAYIGINFSLSLALMGQKGEALKIFKNIQTESILDLKNYYRNVGDFLKRN